MTTAPDREGWWWGKKIGSKREMPEWVGLDKDGSFYVECRESGFPWIPLERFEWGARIPGPEEVELAATRANLAEMARQLEEAERRVGTLRDQLHVSCLGDARTRLSRAEAERAEANQHLIDRVRAPAAPPVRDETRPAPGWTVGELSDSTAELRVVASRAPGGRQCKSWEEAHRFTWSRYDAEHGYAPPPQPTPDAALREALVGLLDADALEVDPEEWEDAKVKARAALAGTPPGKAPEGTAPERPHRLTWSGAEWVAPCGCRYHPDDDNGSHGGAPHVHRCEKHGKAPDGTAPERAPSGMCSYHGPFQHKSCTECAREHATRPPDGMTGEPPIEDELSYMAPSEIRDLCRERGAALREGAKHARMLAGWLDPEWQGAGPPTVPGEPECEDPPDDHSIIREGDHGWTAWHKTTNLGYCSSRDNALSCCRTDAKHRAAPPTVPGEPPLDGACDERARDEARRKWAAGEPVPKAGVRHHGTRSDGKWGCDACCNGDRCDDSTHVDRRKCGVCNGTGAIPDALLLAAPPTPPRPPVERPNEVMAQAIARAASWAEHMLGTMGDVLHIDVKAELKGHRDSMRAALEGIPDWRDRPSGASVEPPATEQYDCPCGAWTLAHAHGWGWMTRRPPGVGEASAFVPGSGWVDLAEHDAAVRADERRMIAATMRRNAGRDYDKGTELYNAVLGFADWFELETFTHPRTPSEPRKSMSGEGPNG